MNLIINFTKKRGEIELKLVEGPDFIEDPRRQGRRDKKCIDSLTFDFESNLDSVLISAVDKILKRNKIETLSLKSVKILGDIQESSSANRIVQAFIEAWKSSKQAKYASSAYVSKRHIVGF